MTVLHENIWISNDGLSILDMFGQNLKLKYLMYQILIKILKHHASPNLSYQNSNICISKIKENQSKTNACNTEIPKLWL